MASSAITQRIQSEISSNPVMVYSKSTCPFCVTAKQVLGQIGVNFTAIELNTMSEGGAIQDALQQMTNQRTVPNIFIGGEHLGGCSDLQNGVSSGRVQGMLSKHSIPHNG